MIVNDNFRTFLFNQRRRHFGFEECARNISDWYCEEVTAEQVQHIWEAMFQSGWVKAKRAKKARDAMPAESDPVSVKLDLRRRSVMHLLDLKRAGHSPNRTEYRIEPEGRGVRYPTAPIGSYIGSSAGMCAETV